ncbi:E3 ubiquitin ligase complex SCF subunit sconC [Globomyces pollinis-pini]|nr:E3 ubiquitin ligase complex SCF subunit sconC [Globomyces pollinis-pini]
MTTTESELIKLRTSDDVVFSIEKHVIVQSVLIKNMLNDLDVVDDIPLPNVTSATMKIIVEYLTHHKDDVIPAEPVEKKLHDISDFDKELLNVVNSTLFDIILAANYLDIPSLLDVGCRCVAIKIKGKSVEEIQKEFNIPKEHHRSDEEIAKMKEELKGIL